MRCARSSATGLRRLQPMAADYRPKATQVLAEPAHGSFKLRDPAEEDGGADIGAHDWILGKRR